MIECSECGHLHFDPATRRYDECPIEGCKCPLAPREYDVELFDESEPVVEPHRVPILIEQHKERTRKGEA